ncbi:hypothetical protein HALLA_18640 [Halostagnicola larsenii XH-48]|uniref:Uncharacterized protein n=1 Tax=Halostagnicola larsenii XH-48 TaxID=797299 RepID=W0JU03_9EURY|nr:hypothetical protein [Halostagnicola larsenii]AHG00508.1 hypothetical protein HALLA_18640 [Halostagnicola larsenii XH-48]
MVASELQTARTELDDAVDTAGDDIRDDLRETAAEFSKLETETETVDHAVLDDHLNTLRQLRERAGGETEAAVDRALEHAESYREDLEQA